jgi:hypothetical protein
MFWPGEQGNQITKFEFESTGVLSETIDCQALQQQAGLPGAGKRLVMANNWLIRT